MFSPPGVRNATFWACHVVLWANIVFYVIMVIMLCIQCSPMEAIWNPLVDGTCRFDLGSTELASSVVNFITDVVILLIPQRAIWTLNLAQKRKAGVAAVFAIGLLGVIAAGIRIYYTAIVNTNHDYTYVFSSVMACALGEGTCAIIVMCGPMTPRSITALSSSNLVISVRTIFSSQRLISSARQGESGPSSIKSKWPAERLNDRPSRPGSSGGFPIVPLQNVSYAEHTHELPIQSDTSIKGIYRKTQFETSGAYDINAATSDYDRQHQHQQQHPWNHRAN